MKFTDVMLEIQKLEKRIVIARCGVFMTAIGRDAILLNKLFNLKVTCLKPNICKVGIPVTYTFKYLEKLEELGYGYVVYDYNKTTKNNTLKYSYQGKGNEEESKCLECLKCERYKSNSLKGDINIFEMLNNRVLNNNKESNNNNE